MARGDGEQRDSVYEVEDYRHMWDSFRVATEERRTEAILDYDYYHGRQLTRAQVAKLNDRGQPVVWINRTKTAVNGILGVAARARTDPRCLPRTPDDEDAASVATDILRYIEQKNRFDYQKVHSFRDYLIGGTMAVLIGISDDKEVTIEPIRYEEYFCDPRARREDLKDATYHGIAKWMYVSKVKQMYPDFAQEIQDSCDAGFGQVVDELLEDRPFDVGVWLDQKDKRILVIEVYHLYRGRWMKCVFYGGGILEEGESPYRDEKGRTICPIEAQSAYVTRENEREGIVRDMRPIQDEINKRRSKLLHQLNSSQIQARDPSAVEVDPDTARKEAARPDGVLPFGWEKVSSTDSSQGQMQLLGEAKDELERFGPNPAVLGRQGSDSSGRALLTRQQAGLVELALLFDGLEDWELRVYRQCWFRAKQFWDEPKYLRVTDNEDDYKFVHVNAPKPAPEIPQEAMGQLPPDLQQMMASGGLQPGQPAVYPEGHPLAGEAIFGYENAVGTMDVDVIIDTSPETANIMEEQLTKLIEVLGVNPAYSQQVPFEVIIDLMPLPRKRQIMQKVKQHAEQQSQAAQQAAQQAQQAAMEKLQVEIEEIKSQIGLNKAKAIQATAQAEATMSQADTRAQEVAHRAITDADIAEKEAEKPPERNSDD